MTFSWSIDSHSDKSAKPKLRSHAGKAGSAWPVNSQDIPNGEGYDAIGFTSGVAAVELARRIQPDVIISDVAMPDMNGIETVQRIRVFLPD